MYMAGLSSSIRIAHIACYWRTLAFALHKSSVSTAFAEDIMLILHILCYNGSLVTRTVVSLTTANFKPLMFSMSGFALSYTANMLHTCRCHQQRDLDKHQVLGAYHLYIYIYCTMWATRWNLVYPCLYIPLCWQFSQLGIISMPFEISPHCYIPKSTAAWRPWVIQRSHNSIMQCRAIKFSYGDRVLETMQLLFHNSLQDN
jgi:hypothetical protein